MKVYFTDQAIAGRWGNFRAGTARYEVESVNWNTDPPGLLVIDRDKEPKVVPIDQVKFA